MTEGHRIRVRGQVQGVGFRPFVWQLAQAFGAAGEVLNDPEGVLIHLALADPAPFLAALRDRAPPLARIDAVELAPHVFDAPPQGFAIAHYAATPRRVGIDAAQCQRQGLFWKTDRHQSKCGLVS